MKSNVQRLNYWPEDPAWPNPFGDDPYDIFIIQLMITAE